MFVWLYGKSFNSKIDDNYDDDINNDDDHLIFLPSEIQPLNSSSLLCADF